MSTEQQELADVTDAQLFDSAIAAEAPAIPEKEAPEPEPVKAEPEKPASQDEPKEQQPRDPESGRWASKTEEPAADKKAEPVKEAPDDKRRAEIPPERLREEAIDRRIAARMAEESQANATRLAAENAELSRRLTAMEAANRPPPQPVDLPDPLLDPDGYRSHMQRQLQEGLENQSREFSLRFARSIYKQEFDEAYQAGKTAVANGDHLLQMRMKSAADPGETLIQWHREQKTMREVGNDPNAWLEKKLEERLKDPAFLAKAIESAKGQATASTAQPNSRPAIDLPPSLSSATRANSSRSSDADDNDVSDEALFRQALR